MNENQAASRQEATRLAGALIQELCNRGLEDDDLLVSHEFGALDIEDGH
jgi:hypothetical protein